MNDKNNHCDVEKKTSYIRRNESVKIKETLHVSLVSIGEGKFVVEIMGYDYEG